jgi:hypothetical protein
MKVYRSAPLRMMNKQIDWDSDTLVWTLHTSTYTPNLDTHAFASDLTNELGAGGGYTAGTASGGGLAIASPTSAYTAANSFAVSRANSTAYALEDVFRPASANGFLYRVAVAGTSGGTLPTFPTVLGTTVADGTATIECVGSGIIIFACSDPTWTPTFTAGPFRYAVLSDRSSASLATDPLIGYVDLVTDKTGGGGPFTINLHATLRAFHVFTP